MFCLTTLTATNVSAFLIYGLVSSSVLIVCVFHILLLPYKNSDLDNQFRPCLSVSSSCVRGNTPLEHTSAGFFTLSKSSNHCLRYFQVSEIFCLPHKF